MRPIRKWWDHLSTDARVGFGGVGLVVVTVMLMRFAMWFKDYSDSANNLASVLAIMLGGGWVLYQYGVKRSGESGLLIGAEFRSTPYNAGQSLHLVSIDVTLKNTGNCRLTAKPDAFSAKERKELEDSIEYSCDLQVRRIRDNVLPGSKIDWWEKKTETLEPHDPDAAMDLLMEYTRRKEASDDYVHDFFMEPGEEYHLGKALVLETGHYMAKVVFLGDRDVTEYWSRITTFTVPTAQNQVKKEAAS